MLMLLHILMDYLNEVKLFPNLGKYILLIFYPFSASKINSSYATAQCQ